MWSIVNHLFHAIYLTQRKQLIKKTFCRSRAPVDSAYLPQHLQWSHCLEDIHVPEFASGFTSEQVLDLLESESLRKEYLSR